MVLTVGNVECEYEVSGNGQDGHIVFLHGWGGGLSSFSGAIRFVTAWGVSCVNLAFPTRVPKEWGIYDYAEYVKRVLDILKIVDPIIVGHSFGGRIGIILAAQGVCKKLVLADSAGMKPHPSISKKLKIARYHRRLKCGKSLDGTGSVDYNNIEPDLRPVFVRIVNTHLERLLPYIECETLIFWGKADRDTPPYMAKRLKRGIKNSRLVFSDGGHYAYIDENYLFLQELKSFILE